MFTPKIPQNISDNGPLGFDAWPVPPWKPPAGWNFADVLDPQFAYCTL